MALMRTNIQKTLVPSIGANLSVGVAHGLGAIPDTVQVRFVDVTYAGAPAWIQIRAVIDSASITLVNSGAAASGDMEVVAMLFHSMIQ